MYERMFIYAFVYVSFCMCVCVYVCVLYVCVCLLSGWLFPFHCEFVALCVSIVDSGCI